MTAPRPLPDELQPSGFTRAAAAAAGVRAGRMRRKDVLRPFRGIQATVVPSTVAERCRAYAPKLKPGQFFSHTTGALLRGIPLPAELEAEAVLHVAAVRPADAPHSRGIVGHRLTGSAAAQLHDGLPVADLLDLFCQLGAMLSPEDLVVVADDLLNRTTLDQAAAGALMLERIGASRRIGSAALVHAVRAARQGSRSPAETRVRLVLLAVGVPEPELNAPIHERGSGRYLGSPDLVWRDQRVVVEYEGDQHRTDQDQWRYDVLRYDDLAADGWRVIRVTGDDLTAEGRRRLVQRVRRALDR